MKVSVSVGSASHDDNAGDLVAYVAAAERLEPTRPGRPRRGDGRGRAARVSGAVTDRIRLGSGIMQISACTPAATGWTALSLNSCRVTASRSGSGSADPRWSRACTAPSSPIPVGRSAGTSDRAHGPARRPAGPRGSALRPAATPAARARRCDPRCRPPRSADPPPHARTGRSSSPASWPTAGSAPRSSRAGVGDGPHPPGPRDRAGRSPTSDRGHRPPP